MFLQPPEQIIQRRFSVLIGLVKTPITSTLRSPLAHLLPLMIIWTGICRVAGSSLQPMQHAADRRYPGKLISSVMRRQA